MQQSLLILICCFSFFAACSHSERSTDQTAKAIIPKVTEAKLIPGLPPIYEKFDDLAFIFNQQNDTTYVINFWSTWCAPCVKELPYFEALHQKYLEKKVKVILVSLDFPKQLVTKLKPFLAEKKLQAEVLVLTDPDANSWVDTVNPKWSGAIPATVVYNHKKNEFYEKSFENLEELETVLSPFL